VLSFVRRLPVGKVLLEVFLIVVAVLLALAVDKWREARAEARLVRSVLQTVRAELERNRQLLDARLAYHAAVAKSLHAASDLFFVEDKGIYRLRAADRIPWRQDVGLRDDMGLGLAPDLSDTAWQAALGSGALSSVDYRLFYQLAVAYTCVADVRRTEEHLLEGLEGFDRAYLERQASLTAFFSFQATFQDLELGERELRAETQRVLHQLETALPSRSGRRRVAP
jgi:hypothetical protein